MLFAERGLRQLFYIATSDKVLKACFKRWNTKNVCPSVSKWSLATIQYLAVSATGDNTLIWKTVSDCRNSLSRLPSSGYFHRIPISAFKKIGGGKNYAESGTALYRTALYLTKHTESKQQSIPVSEDKNRGKQSLYTVPLTEQNVYFSPNI